VTRDDATTREDPTSAVRAVTSEAFVLVPRTVTDLDDFVAHPERYLVSIDVEPARAAATWLGRPSPDPSGCEGLLSLRYHGQELIEPDLWDDVLGTWDAIVRVVEGYVADGAGRASLWGQPVEVEMHGRGRWAGFRVGATSTSVDVTDFVPGVLAEAERFFTWVARHVGRGGAEGLARVRVVQSAARTARYRGEGR
jgi:hypothetical protein